MLYLKEVNQATLLLHDEPIYLEDEIIGRQHLKLFIQLQKIYLLVILNMPLNELDHKTIYRG